MYLGICSVCGEYAILDIDDRCKDCLYKEFSKEKEGEHED